MTKKIIIIMIIAVCLIISTLALFRNEDKEIEVSIAIAEKKNIESRVFAAGKIEPVVKLRLSAKIAGEITGIFVKKGDTVKKGAVLVQLDNTDFEAQRLIAEAGFRSARATLIRTNKELKRVKKLYAKNMASEAEIEIAMEQNEIADGDLKSAEASLVQAENMLAKTTIKSPINGKVIEVKKQKGEIALGSDVQTDIIMVIADMSRQKAVVKVNENDIASIELDDEVTIKVDAVKTKPISGKVSEIAGIANTEYEESQKSVTNFKVTVLLDRVFNKIMPGMSANVEILSNRHEGVITLPIRCVTVRPFHKISAVFQDLSQKTDKKSHEVVFRVDGNRVTAVPVRIGISSETEFEILSGIVPGDKIVSGNYQALSTNLEDGSIVRVKPKQAK